MWENNNRKLSFKRLTIDDNYNNLRVFHSIKSKSYFDE